MLNKIKRLFSKMPKSLTALLLVMIFVAVPVAVMGWGPDRPTYDFNKNVLDQDGVPLTCSDPQQAFGLCGSMDGPVFNSFVNTTNYGDERNFNTIAEVVPGQSPADASYGEAKTAEPGKQYWVRTYVHNNANSSTNGPTYNQKGIARNTRVRVEIAEGMANGVEVQTTVSADNAAPTEVWDESKLVNDNQKFSVQYVPGSAVIYGYDATTQRFNSLGGLSDNIMSAEGVNIGNQAGGGGTSGNLPGCFENIVEVFVKVTVPTPKLEVSKVARVAGETNWRDNITAKRDGKKIQWKIEFANRGTGVTENVHVRDTLPAGVTLVPGSVKLYDDDDNGTVVPDAQLTSQNGIPLGNYSPVTGTAVNGRIEFETTINSDFKLCELKNVAFGRADHIPETSDDSKVTIENCNAPSYRCDDLTVQNLGNRKYKFSLTYTAQNASLRTVTYDFGDRSAPLVTNNQTPEYTYAKDGSYTVTTKLTFVANGQDQVVTSADCSVTVTIAPPENCPIPGKTHLPKNSPECVEKKFCAIPGKGHLPVNSPECVIPNTGAGQMIGIFTGTTIAGAAAHHAFTSRRYRER